jgi:hypothetical protein
MDDRNDRPLHERVAALERAITDGHADGGLPDAARTDARLDDVEATVDDVDDRVAELEAAVQALRGFAGGIRAVDESVERRADAAVARVDRLEAELEAVRERVTRRDRNGGAGTATDSNGRATTGRRDARAVAGSQADPSRGDPSAAAGHPAGGDVDAGPPPERGDDRERDDSLCGDVAARTDAALADAAAVADDPDDAVADERESLAGRLRRLL